ncbi:MAG: putative sugar O-methyltransferase [Burkholderiales bacterium]
MIFSIEDSCMDRRSDNHDEKTFERIVAAYRKSKAVQMRSASVYQVSNEWLPIYTEHLGRIMDVLARGDLVQLKASYNNFFRDSCSSGLHGYLLDVPQHFAGNDIHPGLRARYFHDVLHRFKLWWELMEMGCPLNDLQSPNIGNPYGYTIDGHFIRAGADYQHYYASIIARLIRGPGHKMVAEIGGGFGGMAYYLMRDNADLTYLDFDLPENVALTSFYLLTAFPDKKIALFGEVELDSDEIQHYDAALMPSFELHKVRDESVDLTFNSYSLAEMSKETIDDYIAHVNRFTSKFVFHVNHTKVSLVKASDFGISKEKFELVFRSTALWNASRNTDVDEFEYLYKNKEMHFTRDSSKIL